MLFGIIYNLTRLNASGRTFTFLASKTSPFHHHTTFYKPTTNKYGESDYDNTERTSKINRDPAITNPAAADKARARSVRTSARNSGATTTARALRADFHETDAEDTIK